MAQKGPDSSASSAFDLRGYHLQPSALEPRLIDELEEALVRLERVPAAELPAGCPRSWTPVINECRLMNVLEAGQPFERLIDHPSILPWVHALVRQPARLTVANSITRAHGVGLPLHRIETASYRSAPQPNCDMLTAVVWLSDCGPEDGPMVVFEGSHATSLRLDCASAHPRWTAPEHDRDFGAAREDRAGRAWEDVPGYRELHVRRGDLLVFAESIWHGAREVRSQRVRRSLYFSYSPYHFSNWHGLSWSAALKQRVTPARRELLEGPFIGSRLPAFEPPGLPARPEFPLLPDSELGPRVFPASLDRPAPERIARCLARAVARHAGDPGELRGLQGACELRLLGMEPEGLVLRDGQLSRCRGEVVPDAVIEAGCEDFARLVSGELEAVELFNSGRARVRGDFRLAMRLASFLLADGENQPVSPA